MNNSLLKIDISADFMEMKTARKALESTLLGDPQVSKFSNSVVLCFSEIATNIIQHGKASRIEGKLISQANRLYLEVIDDGDVFREMPQCKENLQFDVNQENGRGLNIVSSLTDSVSYSFDHKKKKNSSLLEWKVSEEYARKCILLVDDDPAITALYANYLHFNYRVFVSNSVAHAMTILTQHDIDLVVSDLNMPDKNGVDFRNAINNREEMATLPFIFLTMEDSVEMSARASLLGIDDYLIKPVNKSTLIHTIGRVLTQHQRLSLKLNSRIEQNITRALCPTLPKHVFGWNIRLAARNTGAGGGDLVLFHENEAFSYIVVIDVMGHDDAAKFFSYAYAGYIKGAMLALRDDQIPATLLEMLSHQVYSDPVLENAFLTCSILKVARNGSIEMASAGHPNAYLISGKSMKPIPQTNMMPGLLPSQKYQTTHLDTSNGDRLAIYTDGLLEGCATAGARALLKSDILTNLACSRTQSLDESLNTCFNLFDQHTNHAPEDDALLILMERD